MKSAKRKKGKVSKIARQPTKIASEIVESNVDTFVSECIETYGKKTIEDRSIPDYRDGLKPVQRRILWAMYDLGNHEKMVKAAKVIGHTMGNYHPHGDLAIHGAIATMVNLPTPLIEGQGNWGNPATGDNPAAPRYVEVRLAKFAKKFMLDEDYLKVIDYVPNFDNSAVEPVVLPALLPTVFLTGAYGIAVGVATSYPVFSLDFVAKIAAKVLRSGKTGTAKSLAKSVKFDYKEGGNCISEDDEIAKLFTTGNASIVFEAQCEVDPAARTLVVNSNAAKTNLEAKMKKIGEMPEVRSVMNQTTDKIRYTIEFKPSVTKEEVETLSQKIIKSYLTTRVNFSTVVTSRRKSQDGDEVDVTFDSANIIEIFENWASWRIRLEKKVLRYRIGKLKEQVARWRLLLMASEQVVAIAKEVAKKQPNLNERIAKLLKVSSEEADIVLSTPIRSLANMEQKKVKSNIADCITKLKAARLALKNPGNHCADSLVADLKLA